MNTTVHSDSELNHMIRSAAKVLTRGDTNNLMLPLRGEGRTIERHLRIYDPHSWRIIRGHMESTQGFVEAVFAAIHQTEGVLFRTSELASLLLALPEGENLRGKLETFVQAG